MRLLYGHDQTVADFVQKLIPRCTEGFGNCKAIGVLDSEGQLIGGMVYSGWDPHSQTIEMSGASLNKKWLTKKTLQAMFDYPFEVAGCQMVVMRNSENQKALHRMLRAYDFKEYKIPRLYGRDEAAHFWTLTDDDWKQNKFMRGTSYGQE